MLVLKLVPNGADELRHGDGVRVMSNQSQHEDAILSQVLLDEVTQQFLVGVALQLPHQLQVFLDVPEPIGAEHRSQGPCDETEEGHGRDEHHPEPQKQVDLLVEQVDRKDALHRVALNVSQSPHLQIAHRDPREPRRLRPILTAGQLLQDVDSIHVVLRPQERVQYEQLTHDVCDEEDLHVEVESDEVVAASTSARRAEGAGEEVLQADGAATLGFVLARQVSAEHNEGQLGNNSQQLALIIWFQQTSPATATRLWY